MKAVLMAGGEGSRLRPLTILRPKPMVPIVNKPVMEHVLDLLRQNGITEVIVTVQYLASVIQDYFGDGSSIGLDITYSIEEEPLGTAGSVKQVESQLDETFLVISADALTDFDLGSVVEYHRSRQAAATLTLYQVPNPLEYGVVIIDEEGNIREFLEKPSWGEVFSDTVNTGIYVLEPRVFDYIEKGKSVDFSQDVFPRLLSNNDRLFGYVASGYWCDVGNIQEYMRATADVLNGKVALGSLGEEIATGIWRESDDVFISPEAQIYGPVWLGRASEIRSGAIVRGPTVIRDYVVINEHAQVDRSVIWRNSYIGEQAEVRGAIICRQVSVKNKAMVFEGAVIGDRTSIGEEAIIQPSVKVWPDKQIDAGATVSSSLIWGSQARRILFGRWGVTGLVNIDLTPELAAKLGAAYGTTLPKGATVTVNRDPQRSARMIKRALISGLPSSGINVLDIKSMPVPVARYITRVSDADGGVHVQLSPYDDRVVDVKIFDQRGLDVDRKTERKIENWFFREDVRRVYRHDIGLIQDAPNLSNEYIQNFIRTIGDVPTVHDGHPLIIDYAHSPAVQILPPILRQFGWAVVALNAEIDDQRFLHRVESFEAGLERLAIISRSLEARLAVRLDAGGERIFAFDEYGRRVDGWMLLGVAASLMLREHVGGQIAVPVNAPTIFDTIAERFGGHVIRTRAESQALMSAGSRDGVILAGDGNGGLIFPQLHPAMDGLFATARIYQLLMENHTGLAKEVADLPAFHIARTRVACPWESKGTVMRVLAQRYQHDQPRQVDGIKINLQNRDWVLVLPDVDRPLFHIIAEASSSDGARGLTEEYAALVTQIQQTD